MGHHYRHQVTLPIGDLAENIAIWELHLASPTASKPVFVWNFELSLASNVAAAGALAFRLQREATVLHAAGATVETVAPVSLASPATGVVITHASGAALATSATNASGFLSAALGSTVAGASEFCSFPGHRIAGDVWVPLCVVTSTQQLVLVTDVDIPAAMVGFVSLSIHWEEGP